MDIMIATGNKNKVREYKEMLEPLGFTVHDTSELTGYVEPVEDGTTFAENALIKARGVYDHVAMISIADDSGLSIRALNNEPGIYSARYMEGHDYPEKNRSLIKRLEGCEDRYAWFTCAIALIDHNGNPHVFEGIMEGEIAFEPAGSNGFGYDPIFMLPELGKTSAELKPEEKNAISHRGQATRKLIAYLKEEYGNE
ncbi:MAG: RdgB/HAM1 family non-canonical purine NTP pyrophosphatase [Erysipelotrichaceae bacterium]|nr:RdgB/HAM1 family non-canonical purine NTP pyrophosphatase [Erysipelotrichaceae bacterium]MBR2545251.1 RdgB/HAM1 family non-canonical purine NTP pyrophosphatase [Erysipelotrichaceae bacterium]MBR2702052.1 RdgB/HAM1 family non-canonical purine NTP pyrophosphatase [Erysipelotrichaceae bacterium]